MPGLPATTVIHPDFQQHHRPVAAGQMTGTCRIERLPAGPAVWDDAAGTHVPPSPTLLYDGPCRYQHLSPAGQPIVADTETPLADVRITVPVPDTVEYTVNDLVTLTGAADNPDLAGRTLRVTAVSAATISVQRDLTCQLRQPTTR